MKENRLRLAGFVIDQLFINCSTRRLKQSLDRIDKCVARLTEDQVWSRGHESENSVGNLLLHLGGNVRQWIIAGVGATPDTRDRDSEFNARSGPEKGELLARLRGTVEEACGIVEGLTAERLTAMVHIQKYDVSVLEAIYHVVEHFAQHTGQIIFATKLLTGEELGFYTHLKRPTHAEPTP
jgi:uncharacterized damage-inducible protein DinB